MGTAHKEDDKGKEVVHAISRPGRKHKGTDQGDLEQRMEVFLFVQALNNKHNK